MHPHPGDNCVATYLQSLFEAKNPETVCDVIDVLRDIPEYAAAEKYGMPDSRYSPAARSGATGKRATST